MTGLHEFYLAKCDEARTIAAAREKRRKSRARLHLVETPIIEPPLRLEPHDIGAAMGQRFAAPLKPRRSAL